MSAVRNNSSKYVTPNKSTISPIKNSIHNKYPNNYNNNMNSSNGKFANNVNNLGSSNSNFYNTNKSTGKGMLNSNDFSRQLRSAQNHAEENIEDEYIKNLQQQIAYQELELKLLKEKEMEQKASVAQIDKFFNDGIPLNENILALKNQYNQQHKQSLNRIDELNEQRHDEMMDAADLKNKYEKSQHALKTIMDSLDKKEKDYVDHMNQTRIGFINERNRRMQADKDLKKLQKEIKDTNDHNLKMTRDLEREAILVHQKEEALKSKRHKTLEDLKAKDDWIQKLGVDVEKKRQAATFNPEITFLENENLDLTAKQIRCEKEANIARAKIKEMEMFLDSRRRERQLEAQQKRDLVTKIASIKFQIDEQNKMNETEIKNKVAAKEEKEKKDLEKEIAEVKQAKTVVKHRHQEKEDILRDLLQDKMSQKQDIMALEQETAAMDKEIKEKNEVLVNLKTNDEAMKLEEKELDEKLHPIEKEIVNMKTITPQIEKHNEELKERIAHEEKKNELSMQIKNVNLEELMLLVQSNDQVQSTITDVMRKWDMLLRMSENGKH